MDGRIQTDLIGPVPSFFAKMGGWYRWQIVLRGPGPASLLRGIPLTGWRVEVDPVSLL
jgi:primosomal protein N' (replication factor Y)